MRRLPSRPVLAAPALRLAIAKELCRTRSIKTAAFNCKVSYTAARNVFLADVDVSWTLKKHVEHSESPPVQGYLPLI